MTKSEMPPQAGKPRGRGRARSMGPHPKTRRAGEARDEESVPRHPGGRPPIGDAARKVQLPMRITEDERERWRAAAVVAGLPLSEWIRAACEREAKRK